MLKTLIAAVAMLFTVNLAHADPISDFFKSFNQPTHQQNKSYKEGAGRPAGCPVRWCGCWLRLRHGLGKDYDLARNWAKAGTAASKGCIGCIAVLRSHVGEVQGYDKNGNPVILSGNHGKKVGVGTYSAGRIIAYRHV